MPGCAHRLKVRESEGARRMAARAAQSLRGRLLGFSFKESASSSSSHSFIRHVDGNLRGFTALNNSRIVDSSSGLRRALSSLGLGFEDLRGDGAAVVGKRFFRVSSVAQEQSLVTPSEELQDTTAVQTAELTREMQLKSIDEARARIFGHVIGNGERSAHKVLRKKLIGDKIVAWYPTPIQKLDPMFEDPNVKRRQLKTERAKRRGKGPPKKGHGKRAAKRAK